MRPPRGPRRGDAAGPGDQQHPGPVTALGEAGAELGSRLTAEHEVDQRDIGVQALGELECLLARSRGEATLDPGLALQQQPESPVDDVVVVDHEHAQGEIVAVTLVSS